MGILGTWFLPHTFCGVLCAERSVTDFFVHLGHCSRRTNVNKSLSERIRLSMRWIRSGRNPQHIVPNFLKQQPNQTCTSEVKEGDKLQTEPTLTNETGSFSQQMFQSNKRDIVRTKLNGTYTHLV